MVSFFVLLLCVFVLVLGNILKNSVVSSYAELLGDFIFTPSSKLESVGDRTNILILGKGGDGHTAPDLTDTIIFVSFSRKSKDVNFISLPRDIWITSLRAKLNSAYYWGNQKAPPNSDKKGGGLVLAKSVVEEIVGQPIQYALVIDFNGFKRVIDVVGGIDVDVANSFVDNKYPIAGKEEDLCEGDPEFECRYETIQFDKGFTHMSGETALKFVRSRNAEGDEGTDFARAGRQERVINALKGKVLSREVLLSIDKLTDLKNAILSSTETDIDPSAASILTRFFINTKDNSHSYVLPMDLLVNPPKSDTYDNLYVFIPKDKDWKEIHTWINCSLEGNSCQQE